LPSAGRNGTSASVDAPRAGKNGPPAHGDETSVTGTSRSAANRQAATRPRNELLITCVIVTSTNRPTMRASPGKFT